MRREAVVASASAVAAREGFLSRSQDLVLPVAIIASVLVIMVPLPAALMDVLLSANITVAVIMLLDDDLRAHAARVQHLSDAAVGDHAGTAGAQRGHDAADSHAAPASTASTRPGT